MNTGETTRLSRGSHDIGRAGRAARFGMLLVLIAPPAFASSYEDCAISGACCFPRGSLPSPRVRAPRLATITNVGGPLRKPAVKRVLGERTAALGACAGTGEVRAHVIVVPSGRSEISRVVAASPQLATCATEALRVARFPVTTDVTELDVRITW